MNCLFCNQKCSFYDFIGLKHKINFEYKVCSSCAKSYENVYKSFLNKQTIHNECLICKLKEQSLMIYIGSYHEPTPSGANVWCWDCFKKIAPEEWINKIKHKHMDFR